MIRRIRNMCKFSAILAVLAFISISPVKASHLAGGDIYYEWISGNTYRIKLSLYIDCGGLGAPSNATVSYESLSCGYFGGTITLNQSSAPSIISPLCPSSISQSVCNGGPLVSLYEQKYEGQVTLPGACNDWEFSYTNCCRNGLIQNIVNPDSQELFLSAFLNNLDTPFNNSCQFGGTPIHKVYNGTMNFLNWNGYDIDGDLLVFELTEAKASGGPIAYTQFYSYLQPFIAAVPTTIDSTNGIVSVYPNAIQTQVLAVKISEFRNGIKIGSVTRDLQMTVINSTNNLPSLSGVNGTGVYTAYGCPGTPIQFTVYSNDPDFGQNVTISMHQNGTSANLTSVPGFNPTGTFTWTPTPGDISPLPHMFIFTVHDDKCNYYGTQNYAFQVYVNPCNTNDVWPGDANADGVANLYDLLAIGQAFNDNDTSRPNASINWIAQPCPDWANYFPSGVNHKHADTDGNGVVNFGDTTAINVNFGQTHPRIAPGLPGLASTDLIVTSSSDTVGILNTATFDISLSVPGDSIYGLAFRLFLDPSLIYGTNVSVSYPGSVFGTNGVDMVKTERWSSSTGITDIALSRINQQNIMGSGAVARVTIVTTDNVSGKVTMSVVPFDIVGITIAGDSLSLNGVGDELVIDPAYVGLPNQEEPNNVMVYPVPSNGTFYIETLPGRNYDYTILDSRGRLVMENSITQTKTAIDARHLPKGVYTLRMDSSYGSIMKKLVIF